MSGHLSPGVLRLPEGQRDATANAHLATCPKCRVEVRLLGFCAPGEVAPAIRKQLTDHVRQLSQTVQRSIDTMNMTTWAVPTDVRPSKSPQQDAAGQIERYEMRRWLGAGTDAMAHLATDRQSELSVVVKMYHKNRRHICPDNDVLNWMYSIDHPNLCRVLDGSKHGEAFVVLAHVDGPDVVSWIQAGSDTGAGREQVDFRRVRAVLRQVLAGLHALEVAGHCHGRLHPNNIRVDDAGIVVLLDHGLPVPEPMNPATPAWNPAAIYRAPEHRTSGGASIAGDLYALGVVLAEAMTGSRPRLAIAVDFAGLGLPADLLKLVNALLQTEPTLRPSVSDVIAKIELGPFAAHVGEDRYDLLGQLGEGGMGEVRRVLDRDLNRTLAMKVQKGKDSAAAAASFVAEAQLTAQLQHPAIVPVHALGRFPNGQTYFTMKEIRGEDLAAVIRRSHGTVSDDDTGKHWTLNRLIQALHRVCEAVAYAHSRGVVHRDLKPENIMVGDFGEVLLVDWGIAQNVGGGVGGGTDPILISVERPDEHRPKRVTGTPSYMAPELFQMSGAPAGFSSDVYALGATLYHILAGRPPYLGRDQQTIAAKVIDGPPVSLHAQDADLSAELVAICEHAMARTPDERPAAASDLVRALGAWLDGSKRGERALELVSQADMIPDRIRAIGKRAKVLDRQAMRMLEAVKAQAPVAEKRAGWTMQDEAKSLRQEAGMMTLEYVQTLQAALHHAPLAEAHARLADHYAGLHERAEAARADVLASEHEAMLRVHDRTGRYAQYLKGEGLLSLVTQPPGATVSIHRYVVQDRRLVARVEATVLQTPIAAHPLQRGSYLLIIQAPGFADIRYPVFIDRDQHWSGVCRVGEPVTVIPMTPLGEAPERACFVPPGRTWIGGDPKAQSEPFDGQWVWVDGFWMTQDPVTIGEYIAFLNAVVNETDAKKMATLIPQELTAVAGAGTPLFESGADGFRMCATFAEGGMTLRSPMTMVDRACARAYAAWMGERTGQPWRLPTEIEWEKAARGVDGRCYPWGDGYDPSWTLNMQSHLGQPVMGSVDAHLDDESPYGVRGMAGNVRDWCIDERTSGGTPRIADGVAQLVVPLGADEGAEALNRGGSWYGQADSVRCATRSWCSPLLRSVFLGFRLCLPV